MAARRASRRSTPSPPEKVNDLRQVLEDLEGVERLLTMQITLLREIRLRIQRAEAATETGR